MAVEKLRHLPVPRVPFDRELEIGIPDFVAYQRTHLTRRHVRIEAAELRHEAADPPRYVNSRAGQSAQMIAPPLCFPRNPRLPVATADDVVGPEERLQCHF